MSSENSRDALIARIYETALSPGDWGELLAPLVQWSQAEGAQGKEGLEQLLGHMERAVRTSNYMHALEDQNRLVDDITSRLPWPMLMLDSELQVVKCNAAARSVLSHGSVQITDDDSLVMADQHLKRQLARVVRLEKGRQSQLLHSDYEQLALLCMPVARSDAEDRVARITTVVWVFAGQCLAAPSAQALQGLFNLTPAESRLLHLLCKVGNLTQSAELLSVSVHTARSQMKSIMAKVGVSSQVALVSLAVGHALLAEPSRDGLGGQQEQLMLLADGRVLSWFEYGSPEGRPLIVLENQGGCLPCHEQHQHWYEQQGLRVLVVVRPGFGISSPHPGASFMDFADDLRQFCQRLRLEDVLLGAYCFGGPFALAAAARHPRLFSQVGVIGSIVPREYLRIGWLDPFHRMLWDLANRDPRLFRYLGKLALRGVLRAPEKFFSYYAKMLDDCDARLITSAEVHKTMLPQMRQRWFQGARVIIDECLLMQKPWGFSLASIRSPVLIWHGARDRSVRVECVQQMAAAIPGARFHAMPEQGRYPVIEGWRDFLSALLASAKVAEAAT